MAKSARKILSQMVSALKSTQTTQSLKVSLKRDKLMAMEGESHQGVKSTKDPLCTIKCKEKGCSNGPMADFTMVVSSRVKNMARVPTCGQMVKYTRGSSN